MPQITVTLQEEGQAPVGFIIPDAVAEKIDLIISEANSSTEVGVATYKGKSDWFYRRCYELLLKPVLDKFPDPEPEASIALRAEAAEKLRQASQIQAMARIVPILEIPTPAEEPTK